MKVYSFLRLFLSVSVFILVFGLPTNTSGANSDKVWDSSSGINGSNFTTIPVQLHPVWKGVLFVYSKIDVSYFDVNGVLRHFIYTVSESEKSKAVWAFRQYASNTQRLSENQALVVYDVIYIDRVLTTLSEIVPGYYWVSPEDIRPELDQFAPTGTYDSVFVYWPMLNLSTGAMIPSWGWGLSLSPSPWSNGATYATVGNGMEEWWLSPTGDLGEIWLHEWLHGVCGYYSTSGYPMPNGDADGGGSHQYEPSPTDGWSAYYHDLMTGNVLDNGILTGVTASAWQTGSIIGTQKLSHIDHFYSDTMSLYSRVGTITWQSDGQDVSLGIAPALSNNAIYISTPMSTDFVISGRVNIPEDNYGEFDSVSIAIKGGVDEYWATLAYGSLLTERGKISINKNDNWGDLYTLNVQPGWYTVKVELDYELGYLRMKAWRDTENEPGWLLSRSIDPSWRASEVGFRHYGLGVVVDDLYVLGNPPSVDQYKVFLPLLRR